jgi:hypothetical protein
MKIEIDEYRGWTISFDTEKETFYCYSNLFDKDETKKSFSSIKKWIDEFIKENVKFKPVLAELKPDLYAGLNKEKIKLVGIRKDGRFIYEDEQGKKGQLGEYYEDKYILYDPNNEIYKKQAKDLEDQISVLNNKRTVVLKNIVGIDLREYKKQL